MPAPRPQRNRGPAAAASNRRAILAAARHLFAERGYHVPLNAIARRAGVGQGVLYRHFPSRLDLAFTVFEENFVGLEQIAADTSPGAFSRLWDRLLDLTIDDSAFLEMVVDARTTVTDYDGGRRLYALIEEALTRDQAAGLIRSDLTPADVMVAQRMAYGIIVTAVNRDDLRDVIERALPGFGG